MKMKGQTSLHRNYTNFSYSINICDKNVADVNNVNRISISNNKNCIVLLFEA